MSASSRWARIGWRAIAAGSISLGAAAGVIAIAVAACGGSVSDEQPDGCPQPPDASVRDVGVDRAPPWWADVFDASLYIGFDPPVPGEYPPSGSGPCTSSGCFVQGSCDPQSGWCCGGRLKKGACVCGADAGCVPPAICCAVPGELVLRCVATPDDCPDAR